MDVSAIKTDHLLCIGLFMGSELNGHCAIIFIMKNVTIQRIPTEKSTQTIFLGPVA